MAFLKYRYFKETENDAMAFFLEIAEKLENKNVSTNF